jgi:hypothetical protein
MPESPRWLVYPTAYAQLIPVTFCVRIAFLVQDKQPGRHAVPLPFKGQMSVHEAVKLGLCWEESQLISET